ncbi:MAG: RNA-binding transcriptional accessory protein [Bacteroidales bacterium]|nr:RNA-binding transcriptional accessory protein [Bacteroidales bacterium]
MNTNTTPLAGIVAELTSVTPKQAATTIALIDSGATIPFIARYRKEATGALDEVKIADIATQYARLQELEARKATILKTIEEQGALTDELRKKIEHTYDSSTLEDLYLPYKPKRRTRAQKAKELGLEPLAKIIFAQRGGDIEQLANGYITDKVTTADEALQGARDIIAEWVADDAEVRDAVRNVFRRSADVTTKLVKGHEEDAAKYADYFDRSENLSRCPSHRVLAMMRAEREGFIRINVAPEDTTGITNRLNRKYVRGNSPASRCVEEAVEDAYERLIAPSIATEILSEAKEKADTEAIRVFADNLRQLLLAAPLGAKRVLALDPGFRTGCKVVCLDEHGQLKHHSVIFPHPPHPDVMAAEAEIRNLCNKYKIEAIAIGNGTASRETESFVRNLKLDAQIFVVSEDGASVYSASATAREEFPDEDVTVRGAVSIGRRLIDPLAELVKIDPKSIGVGQYQHDVDQTRLRDQLRITVESCVNSVGVDLNTASYHLLSYVSGVGPQLAKNIVDYRTENGSFTSRDELHKVPRLGPKAFEQCAGFLRVRKGSNPLDNTGVHPERYKLVARMAKDAGVSVETLIADHGVRHSINLHRYVTEDVGMPTLTDIISYLDRPGLDPRQQAVEFRFAEGVNTIDDLRTGMELPGIVSNITAFGCFVNIGVHQDGLVHISQLADHFVKDPNEVVHLGEHITVRVIDVDTVRKRISLKKL